MSCRSFLCLGQSRFKLFQHGARRKVHAGSFGLITRSQTTSDESGLFLALLNLRPHRRLDKAGQTFPVAQNFLCGAAQHGFNTQRRDGRGFHGNSRCDAIAIDLGAIQRQRKIAGGDVSDDAWTQRVGNRLRPMRSIASGREVGQPSLMPSSCEPAAPSIEQEQPDVGHHRACRQSGRVRHGCRHGNGPPNR